MQHNPRFAAKVPVIIGTNAHEGHLFVYTIYPWPCPRWTYWAFVGLLFKFHASRVLKQYASLAESVAVRDSASGKSGTADSMVPTATSGEAALSPAQQPRPSERPPFCGNRDKVSSS